MFTYGVAVASGETDDAHLDGFPVHWIHSHRRATERDATIQHFPSKPQSRLGRSNKPISRANRKDTEVSPTIWMGHRACDGLRGDR